MAVQQADIDTNSSTLRLKTMIVGVYREMPGLCLHLPQAVRLFGIESTVCRTLLDDLVCTGELYRIRDGQYKLR